MDSNGILSICSCINRLAMELEGALVFFLFRVSNSKRF
ncbi:hypothetical protein EV14_2739 [Prochlorococcus sp. MIT 0703]|nr:hypothetical protein EV12_2746 [Prochlorococcus sp. MIT 0701]KGG30803.1 hypothetical protein EV14_2739 [Prochlorococcus sp. MIT 0703]